MKFLKKHFLISRYNIFLFQGITFSYFKVSHFLTSRYHIFLFQDIAFSYFKISHFLVSRYYFQKNLFQVIFEKINPVVQKMRKNNKS